MASRWDYQPDPEALDREMAEWRRRRDAAKLEADRSALGQAKWENMRGDSQSMPSLRDWEEQRRQAEDDAAIRASQGTLDWQELRKAMGFAPGEEPINPLAGTKRDAVTPPYHQGYGATLVARGKLDESGPGKVPLMNEAEDIRRRLEELNLADVPDGYPGLTAAPDEGVFSKIARFMAPSATAWAKGEMAGRPESASYGVGIKMMPEILGAVDPRMLLKGAAVAGGAGLAAAGAYGAKKSLPYLRAAKSAWDIARPIKAEEAARAQAARLLDAEIASQGMRGPGQLLRDAGTTIRDTASGALDNLRQVGSNVKEGVMQAGSNMADRMGRSAEALERRFAPVDPSATLEGVNDVLTQHMRRSFRPGQEQGQEVTRQTLEQLRDILAPFLEPKQAAGSAAYKEAKAAMEAGATRGWTQAGKAPQEIYGAFRGTKPQGGRTTGEVLDARWKAHGDRVSGPGNQEYTPLDSAETLALTRREADRIAGQVRERMGFNPEGTGPIRIPQKDRGNLYEAELQKLLWRAQQNPDFQQMVGRLLGVAKGLGLM